MPRKQLSAYELYHELYTVCVGNGNTNYRELSMNYTTNYIVVIIIYG